MVIDEGTAQCGIVADYGIALCGGLQLMMDVRGTALCGGWWLMMELLCVEDCSL